MAIRVKKSELGNMLIGWGIIFSLVDVIVIFGGDVEFKFAIIPPLIILVGVVYNIQYKKGKM